MFSSEIPHSQSTQFVYGDNHEEEDNELDDQATTFDINSFSQPLLPPPRIGNNSDSLSPPLSPPLLPTHQKQSEVPKQALPPVSKSPTPSVQKATQKVDILHGEHLYIEETADRPILSQRKYYSFHCVTKLL